MRIPEVNLRDDDYVDYDRYDDGEQRERSEIYVGHLYTARLVVNRLCHHDYAADYFVKVTGRIAVEDHLFQPVFEEKIVSVIFRPCTLDGAELPGAYERALYIEDDGTLFTSDYSNDEGTFVAEEQGYFVADAEYEDRGPDMPGILNSLPVLQ